MLAFLEGLRVGIRIAGHQDDERAGDKDFGIEGAEIFVGLEGLGGLLRHLLKPVGLGGRLGGDQGEDGKQAACG